MIHGILGPSNGIRAKIRFSRPLQGKEDVRFLTRPSHVLKLAQQQLTLYMPAREWDIGKITVEDARQFSYLKKLLFDLYKAVPDRIEVVLVQEPRRT